MADEVGVGVDAAFALPFGGGDDGGVGSGEGDVGEEGGAGFGGGGALGDVGDGVVGDAALDIDGFEFDAGRAFAEEGFFDGGDLGGEAVVDPDEGEHVEGGADAVVVVEAVVEGAVGDGGGVVDEGDVGEGFSEVALVIGGLAVFEWPGHSEVPFADAGGVVAVLFEEAGDGEAIFGDEGFGEASEHAALEVGTPVVAAGEEAVAGGGADAGGSVGVGKAHAFGGEAVEIGGGDFAVRVVGGDVAVALVVGEDDDDVGPVSGEGGGAEDGEGEEGAEWVHERVTALTKVVGISCDSLSVGWPSLNDS